MILVDTSVVVAYLRTADAKLLSLFQAHQAAISGVTRAEVLMGARDPSHRTKLVAALNCFGQISLPESTWDALGDHLAALRAAGVTVPLADALIATAALAHDVELWTRDKHFALIQVIFPALRLFQEPP